ncbi:MAG: biotin transporter BioY [Mycobacteriales bacterium]
MALASPTLTAPRLVLADLLPGTRARDAALVVVGAALVGASAQIAIALPFTPVPLTMQPFAVLLAGATFGLRRGAAAMLLYLLVGLAGVPWFAQHNGGPTIVHAASFGYLLSYPFAAALVGALAARGGDRTVLRTAGSMALGLLVIYAFGLPWLMAVLHVGLAQGLALGVTPFLLGDAIKVALAAGLLPTTWRLIGRS